VFAAQLKDLLGNSVPCTMLELAKFLLPYQLAFQDTYRLLNIALTLPATSASCLHFSAFSGLVLIWT